MTINVTPLSIPNSVVSDVLSFNQHVIEHMTIDIIIVTLCLFCFADYSVVIYANINFKHATE